MVETTVVRCKLRVGEVAHIKAQDGSTTHEKVTLYAVTGGSEENKTWAKYTPSAKMEMTIDNPSAMGLLSSGHEFYVDFTPVPVA